MKSLIILFCAFSTISIFAQENPRTSIATGGIGLDNLKFGESRSRMIEELGMPDDSLMFMGCTCYYSYVNKGIAVGIYNTGQIIQIVLNNNEPTAPIEKKFMPFQGKLKEGITINSTWSDVEAILGKPDEINEIDNQGSQVLQAIYSDKSLCFLITKDYSKILYILVAAKEKK